MCYNKAESRRVFMILLTNNRLRVEISEPGERPNDTFRFD